MRAEAVGAAIFFHDDDSENVPPPVSDPIWSLNDGGQWKDENQFPIYAIPGQTGALLLDQLAQYSGNMSSAPFGDRLVQVYDPADSVRLFSRISIENTAGIPSLWVFLIIVLAILLAIVLATSVVMHFIQRRQRTLLSRRVARGEVDLEALGIKRLNVPQDLLDKMPQYLYTSKAEFVPEAAKVATREVPFTQPTCPICLDDFVHGETTVRELPCNHIFHPECIDPFLRDNSSLCPMCKTSALPPGYCPVNVTNLMVRRERLIRRMRQRNQEEDPVSRLPVVGAVQRRIRTLSMPGGNNTYGLHSSRVSGHGAYNQGAGAEMTNVIRPERVHTSGEQTQRESESQGANAEEVPAEVAARGTAARRAWLREQVARRQQEQYEETAQEARNVDVRRPLCKSFITSSQTHADRRTGRRIGGRFFTRLE